jgi:NADP-dependent 3-hydroxy acid dehydrogenase YdfG
LGLRVLRPTQTTCRCSDKAARRVAAAGGRVLLAGRNKDCLNAARDEIGTSAADTLVLDATDEALGR